MKSISKRSILNIIILVMFALLWGYKIIMYIKTEKENKAYLTMATENAVRYVREKYGFEPEILDITGDQKFGYYNSSEIDLMFIKMKNNDKVFYVRADKLRENPYCIDDYQYEEITSAIYDEISKLIPNGNIIDFRICESGSSLYYLFNKYYSGENIDEILEITSGTIEMVFADVNFSESDLPDKFKEWNISYELTSFDTQERADEFVKYKINQQVITFDNHDYAVYAPYIIDHTKSTSSDGKKSGINYNLKSYDDFMYAYFPSISTEYEDSSDNITITEIKHEIEQKNFTEQFSFYHEESWLSKPLSKVYRFDNDYGDVYIYYPVEKFKDTDIEQIGAAWYSDSGFSNNRGIARAEICGEYAVFTLPIRDQEFMLVDNTGQEEYILGSKKDKNN